MEARFWATISSAFVSAAMAGERAASHKQVTTTYRIAVPPEVVTDSTTNFQKLSPSGFQTKEKVRNSMRGSPESLTCDLGENRSKALPPSLCRDYANFYRACQSPIEAGVGLRVCV